jgi:hypothetical protein
VCQDPVRHYGAVVKLDLLDQLSDLRTLDRRDIAISPPRQNINVEDPIDLPPGTVVRWFLRYVSLVNAAVVFQYMVGHDEPKAAALSIEPSLLLHCVSLGLSRLLRSPVLPGIHALSRESKRLPPRVPCMSKGDDWVSTDRNPVASTVQAKHNEERAFAAMSCPVAESGQIGVPNFETASGTFRRISPLKDLIGDQ